MSDDRRGSDGAPRKLRFAIIGAGMAGILSAIKLTEAGDTDFTIYEKADRLGGTWRENTYPGIACDVPSHLYCYSFAPNPQWSHQFSPGGEIEAYLERVAEEHDVIRTIRFGDEITRCTWTDGRWTLETAGGHRDEVDVVIAATGVLHHPVIPDIEGIDTFAGELFHSARWNHDVAVDGARIGVIGTGSTAVQMTSALVKRAGHFSLFQRTAQWIMPQTNPAYSDEEQAAWREEPEQLRELHDKLAELFGAFARAVVDADSPEMQWIEATCLANLEENVRDPELRERLRPDYRAACKRLVISPDFYEAIQHPNAELVTAAIERIEPGGVRTSDGLLHELDVLVLATGFHADAFMRPMEVTGRGGVKLSQAWAERPRAYYSISIPEFPNFFMLNGPNGPVGNFSLIEVAELQFAYIGKLLERLRSGECRELSPTRVATDDLEAARVEAAKSTVWVTGCRSWYLDDRGIPATWPWSFDRFREAMATPAVDAYEMA
ncbi:MAG TPA: NAD(P)/FAD-dependent oxidoreductase [Acidimicrobiia bacterium]|nr:NAD(P)/FAD-dependent oxidoreductase [Acidimicrobiia bacterium]